MVSIKPGGTDEGFVSSDMSGGQEGSVVAEYAIDVYKKGAKANQLNGEKNPPAKAGVMIVGALLMGMVILAFILKVSNVYQTHTKKQTNKQIACVASVSSRVRRESWDESKKKGMTGEGEVLPL